MKRKSILVGTLALSVMGAASLTSCKNMGEGKDVRNKVSDSDKEVKATHEEGKCGNMKNEDGSAKTIENKCGDKMKGDHKCGEGKCGEGKCGGDETKATDKTKTDHKCGEGKCGEGKCGGK